MSSVPTVAPGTPVPPPPTSALSASTSSQTQDSDLELPPSLASQLELWTNLTFQSDEPLPPPPPPPSGDFDLDGFLSQFGGVQPVFPGVSAGFPTFSETPVWASQQFNALAAGNSSENSGEPPAKKARGRKPSVSISVSDSELAAQDALMAKYESGVPLTPAEDKRRRNTAASARFRLKKKEREAAMERNLKHLNSRVAELEREAEGLRKENGWLRGLLVGVNVPAGVAAAGISAGADEEEKKPRGLVA
ncbi:hypothetical protein CALCODRAFT_503049 [Calocera cornea HHB12733]|uniref:BZIP domain-containing protein n=1 Tax=Calocera cornea HHB12733 TaxID=1353952 RepID=A0A165D1B6_9BASI|nr:hypothetical protein CALCODRAFT_503049 [Calocera cornea HHB12733]